MKERPSKRFDEGYTLLWWDHPKRLWREGSSIVAGAEGTALDLAADFISRFGHRCVAVVDNSAERVIHISRVPGTPPAYLWANRPTITVYA